MPIQSNYESSYLSAQGNVSSPTPNSANSHHFVAFIESDNLNINGRKFHRYPHKSIWSYSPEDNNMNVNCFIFI
jgi:hypothetical protein